MSLFNEDPPVMKRPSMTLGTAIMKWEIFTAKTSPKANPMATSVETGVFSVPCLFSKESAKIMDSNVNPILL